MMKRDTKREAQLLLYLYTCYIFMRINFSINCKLAVHFELTYVPKTSTMTVRRCAGPTPLLASHSYQPSYSIVTLLIISRPPPSACRCPSPISTSYLSQRTIGDGSPDAWHMIDALEPTNSVTLGGRTSTIRAGTVRQTHVANVTGH